MKKALSLILALVMIFALATVAFADQKTDHVVGTHGVNNDHTDGLTDTEFEEDPAEHTVQVTVSTAQVVEKYAVDVTYETGAIQLGGSKMVWNVNTLQYELVASDANNTDTLTKVITITNYSSLPVYAYAAIEKTNGDADGLLVTANYTSANSPLTINDAKAGSPVSQTITISLTPDVGNDKNWGTVVDWYTENIGASSTITVATATIHVLKSIPTP